MFKKGFLKQQYTDKIKGYFGIAVILLFSFFAVKPFFDAGFFSIHDDTQVARVFEMHKSLADGMFPVRWVSDLGYGYGYPIFNFYAPLAYYIGAFFMFLGFDALSATKIMMVLGVVTSGITMYFLAREFWGKTGGIISGLLYLYAPYHALNIYVRGAIAEFWAYAFLPLAFLSIYKIFIGLGNYSGSKQKTKIKRNIWYWACVSSLSYAGIVLSHNLTAMMVTPFLFTFAAYFYIKLRLSEKVYKPHFVLIGLLIGILLSAFYWLPVLQEMKYTNVLSVVGGGSDYKDHFACLTQLWNSPWGFAGSAPGCMDGFSLKIGKLHVALGLVSFFALIPLLKKDRSEFRIIILFLIFLILSILLTLKESIFIWDAVPHMAFFQFPWRFLTLVSFFVSFLGGAGFWIAENTPVKKQLNQYLYLFFVVTLMLVIVISNSKIFVPQEFSSKKSEEYTSDNELKWRVSKISDEYMPRGFFKPLRPVDVPKRRFESNDKNISITSINEKTQYIAATIIAPKRAKLYANIAYFPGWHVFIDNKQVWFEYSGQGLLIDVPEGRHSVDLKFIQTPIEKIGNVISLAGVIILLAGIISHRKKAMAKKVPELSIFFPFWDEQDNIESVVKPAISVAEKLAVKWEIIMVDDGSEDDTLLIAKRLASKDSRLKVISHVPNRGYGAALRAGLEKARYDLVAFTDGDGQFDISEIEKFLAKIERADIVIGFRKKRTDKNIIKRLLLMNLLKVWDLLLFRFYYRDIDCGFKMFRKEAIIKLSPLRSEGAMITTEILAKAKRKKLRIKEVGVTHYPRINGHQSGANFPVIVRAVLESFILWYDLHYGRT